MIDPFEVVQKWWSDEGWKERLDRKDQPILGDCERVGINLKSEKGRFEMIVLGILYSAPVEANIAEDTFRSLRTRGLTDMDKILRDKGRKTEIYNILTRCYPAKVNKSRKTNFIMESAKFIAHECDGDILNLTDTAVDTSSALSFVRRINGLYVKSFWVLRELKMNNIRNFDGKYCCVPDSHVAGMLERWRIVQSTLQTRDREKNRLKTLGWSTKRIDEELTLQGFSRSKTQEDWKVLLNVSEIVWKHLGAGEERPLYDFPLLYYSRTFKCRSENRACHKCAIQKCKDRFE